MSIITVKTMSAEELLLLGSPQGRGQLWDGRFVPSPSSSGPTGVVVARIGRSLDTFATERRLGWVTGPNQGFLVRRNPDRVLCAFVAFTAVSRLPAIPTRHFIPFAPNFALECVEPGTLWDDSVAKAGVWIGHGSDVVWVVDPSTRRIAVLRPGQPLEIVEVSGVASAEPAVPGFTIALADLFAGLD